MKNKAKLLKLDVCPRWKTSFSAFVADIGPILENNLGICRKDNNKGFSKENCYWGNARSKYCKLGAFNRKNKHGGCGKSEYSAWRNMISRCNNENHPSYQYYGARGITVCSEWHKFSNFIRDIGLKPNKEASLERIDNNKGYFKENCRWASKKDQSINRRANANKKEMLPRGVYRVAKTKYFFSRINIEKTPIYIGCFTSKEKAFDAFSRTYYEWYGKWPPC